MPLNKGVRYRMRDIKGGKKQRLAFKDNEVIEAKVMPKKKKKKGKKGTY